MDVAQILNRATCDVLDLLGPTVEILTSPKDADAAYCIMLGSLPPGASVPLHSHADAETFMFSRDVSRWSRREKANSNGGRRPPATSSTCPAAPGMHSGIQGAAARTSRGKSREGQRPLGSLPEAVWRDELPGIEARLPSPRAI